MLEQKVKHELDHNSHVTKLTEVCAKMLELKIKIKKMNGLLIYNRRFMSH